MPLLRPTNPHLWAAAAVSVVIGLACCATIMARAQQVSFTELLVSAQHNEVTIDHRKTLDTEVFNARQGAQDALDRASRNAAQVDLLKEALGGGHPWRHMKNAAAAAAAKKAHEAAVHKSEAWKAGEQALAERDPWSAIDHSLWRRDMAAKAKTVVPKKTVLASVKGGSEQAENEGENEAAEKQEEPEKQYVPLTHVETKDVKPEWAHGAPHPRALVHGEDRYVTVGQEVPKPYVPKVDVEQMAAYRKAQALQQQKHQQLMNTVSAPTLPGGVAVPGGHVVWMPMHALSAANAAPARVAPKAAQAPTSQSLQMPRIQFPPEFSKIVEYGADGKPVATIYGPQGGSAHVGSLARRGRGRRATHMLKEAAIPAEEDNVEDEEVPLPAEDHKIEQDVVFRLLHDYGAPEMDTPYTLSTTEEANAEKREKEGHAWYTFGGRVFESSGARGMPSMFVAMATTVMTILASSLLLV